MTAAIKQADGALNLEVGVYMHHVRTLFQAAPVTLVFAAFGVFAQTVEPAQIPLTSRIAEPPIPNVMLTVDDSGSMLADYVPEGDITVNNWTGRIVNGWVAAFPNDWRKMCSSGGSGCVKAPTGWSYPVTAYSIGIATAVKGGETNFQRRYRSPDVNKIYYNPDVLYLPWWKPDGSGRMENSNPAAARLDPTVNTSTFDLTQTYSDKKTRWYYEPGKYEEEKRSFYPGLVYRLKSGGNPDLAEDYVRYDINVKGEHAPVGIPAARTDCKSDKNIDESKRQCTIEEERQNFANWFTYYRMRESLTKAAISESFVGFKNKLRVGWGRINNDKAIPIDQSKDSYAVIETEENGGPMRLLSASRLKRVLTGVQGLRSWPSTPLRVALDQVGKYFTRDGGSQKGSPWLEDPDPKVSSYPLSCRRSVSLLMTDGYYNDSFAGVGDVDGVDAGDDNDYAESNPLLYQPTKYIAAKPFWDRPNSVSNSLADVAMAYYIKDLDTVAENKVWTNSDDIAFWQHLTQFMVGFGVKGSLDSSPANKAATLQGLREGTVVWPKNDTNPGKIDDMWHAALATGGDFYSVTNVTELTAALVDAFGRATGSEAKEAGVAVAAPFTTADNVKYVPKYKSVSWYGDLEAYALGIDGKQGDLKWRASEQVPPASARNLYTYDVSSSIAKEFKWEAMGEINKGLVGSSTLTDYLRGDATLEGGTVDKPFRERGGKVLGDFVNSPPVLVGNYLNAGYGATDATYKEYLEQKRVDRREPIVVVGGNAGVVHFFRGSDGAEVFGYLPQTGLRELRYIAQPNYGTNANFHRFIVDGPMTEADAKINGTWTNMVLGAMGAGGKSFFALRVPTSYGDATASDFGAQTVMWEKSGALDADVGYMFADFATGKVKGGGYKAFIGNGVYSSSGDAVLLVVDLETGNVEARLRPAAGAGSNGLMGVSLVRDTETNEVMAAYAGDLQGNVWRFEFPGSAPTSWTVGFGGSPLYTATDANGVRQPVTAPPVFVKHPQEGRVVLFGTGRLIDEEDAVDAQSQTYYGVLDPTPVGAQSAGSRTLPSRSNLVRQRIVDTPPVDTKGGTYYKVESQEVDWSVSQGWYVDLPFSRQRVVYPSIVLASEYVYFSTLVPAAEAAQCEISSGEGFNFLLRAADGGVLQDPVLDTNGDGDINDEDEVVQGKKNLADGRDAVIADRDGSNPDSLDADCKSGWRTYTVVNSTGLPQVMRIPCTVSGPLDRVWKQIVNPPI